MNRFLKTGLAAAASLASMAALTGGAQAASVDYTYQSTCTTNCSLISLTDGSSVSGSFTFNDALFAPNAIIGADSVLAFNVTLGSLVLSKSTATGGFAFDGTLGSDGTSFIVFSAFASTGSESAPNFGPSFGIATNNGTASLMGICIGIATGCEGGVLYIDQGANLGPATLTLAPSTTPTPNPSPTHISEPATLALFGFGLLGLMGLGAVRRRRITETSAA
jgi:MYXO-CTERM domain-containing protein